MRTRGGKGGSKDGGEGGWAGIANAPGVAFGPAAPGETTAPSPHELASGRRCGKTYLRRVVCIERMSSIDWKDTDDCRIDVTIGGVPA